MYSVIITQFCTYFLLVQYHDIKLVTYHLKDEQHCPSYNR